MNGSPAVSPYTHPTTPGLRRDRLPHIWCPGCGRGVITGCFVRAVAASRKPAESHAVVSGIGCTGRVAGYLNMDGFHTTHGRAIPFATGLKLSRPELEVTVISGDGDLFAIGGNHFIHAARRNVNINVLCVNNFNYGMTGGQFGSTTPTGARTTTSPRGHVEAPFNLPHLAAAVGAGYVARWTSLHVRQLERALASALDFDGFTFVEVLSPCPVGFGRYNELPQGIDEMNLYRRQCVVDDDHPLVDLELELAHDAPIILGTFVGGRPVGAAVAAGEA